MSARGVLSQRTFGTFAAVQKFEIGGLAKADRRRRKSVEFLSLFQLINYMLKYNNNCDILYKDIFTYKG